MVTFNVVGHRGMLGSVVARRWRQYGAWVDSPADYVINCISPDDKSLSLWLASGGRLIQPSTDAIAEDTAYAAVKRELETLDAVTIRSGLVDLRKSYTHTNWWLNPLTPLEWADLAWEVRDKPGVHIEGREPMSRWDIGLAIAEVFGTDPGSPTVADVQLNRVQRGSRKWPPLREALREWRDWS